MFELSGILCSRRGLLPCCVGSEGGDIYICMCVLGSVVYACNGLVTVVIIVAWRGEWYLVLCWCGDMDLKG